MSETKPDTLLKLLKEYNVIVPIVQRDFAHGRNDEHTKIVRNNLLKDMKSAILRETPPLDLNFVYGKTELSEKYKEKMFIPIDGQQRLTTLFLLHIYAFRDDESKTSLLNKFTYKTRFTSRNFLIKITEKRRSIFNSKMMPSEEINDSEWFVSSWKYDPTVLSALRMFDDIFSTFSDIDDLAKRLSDIEYQPIIFKFLEINDLGMEDSLYIKLNARYKPLTRLENFKAQLIGRLEKLDPDFKDEFEIFFDGKWTDIFWSNNKEKFDITYFMFFGVLLFNNKICEIEENWEGKRDYYEKITLEIFKTIYSTLNFLSDNSDCNEIRKIVFNASREDSTYKEKVLFHAVTVYMYRMYMENSFNSDSLKQWIRIIKNLTFNSRIDKEDLFFNAIEEVNKLGEYWKDLIEYFSKEGTVAFFSREQVEEEQKKAYIILNNNEFAEEIYKAEQHPYFSGQIRAALYYAIENNTDCNIFINYWEKISLLFNDKGSVHGNLLRQALLTFGDYTINIQNSNYYTLCINDPNESSHTPSLKRLFSNRDPIVKQLLDVLNPENNIKKQLKYLVENSTVPKKDWRYCFIKFPEIFELMSISHLRLCNVNSEMIIIPNKSPKGRNYGVFLSALKEYLKQNGLLSVFSENYGAYSDRFIYTYNDFYVRFKKGKFIINKKTDSEEFETKTDDPITEAVEFLLSIH